MNQIEKYLAATGDSMQDLMSGASYFGMAKIDELVDQALKENKRIVWHDEPTIGLGAMSYTFEEI